MARKLYALATEKCAAESADSPMNQEILLSGHLYLMVLKVCGTLVCQVLVWGWFGFGFGFGLVLVVQKSLMFMSNCRRSLRHG